jgi:hypothetical protein
MLNFKTFLIAIAITFLALAGFINSSDAFEIETMESDDGSYEDYNYGDAQGIWHMAYVRTSEPYYTVEWFIDDVYQGSSYGDSNNPKVEAFFWPYWLSGTLGGTKYTIKAVAYPMEGDPISIADSYTLTVYQPTWETLTDGEERGESKKNPDVNGYAELTRHYRSGNDVTMDYYLSASYSGDEEKEFDVSTENKHTIFGLGQELGSDKWETIDEVNSWFSDSGSITNSALANGDRDIAYDCEAYIRITVRSPDGQDDYHFTHTHSYYPD